MTLQLSCLLCISWKMLWLHCTKWLRPKCYISVKTAVLGQNKSSYRSWVMYIQMFLKYIIILLLVDYGLNVNVTIILRGIKMLTWSTNINPCYLIVLLKLLLIPEYKNQVYKFSYCRQKFSRIERILSENSNLFVMYES